MKEEVILAVIPLPIDLATAGKVLKAVSKAFPKAMVRDAEHSGQYFESPELGHRASAHHTVEILLPAKP